MHGHALQYPWCNETLVCSHKVIKNVKSRAVIFLVKDFAIPAAVIANAFSVSGNKVHATAVFLHSQLQFTEIAIGNEKNCG